MSQQRISIMSDQFEDDQGNQFEGVTIILDHPLVDIVELLREKSGRYGSNLEVVHDAFMRGLEDIKNSL